MTAEPGRAASSRNLAWVLAGSIVLAAMIGSVATVAYRGVFEEESLRLVAYAAGGLFFATSSVGSLRIAGHRHVGEQLAYVIYGLTFPLWGLLLAILALPLGGPLGVPHALLTWLVLRTTIRGVIVTLAPLWALALAWGGSLFVHFIGEGRSFASAPYDFTTRIALAVYIWNAVIAVALCWWAVGARRAGLFVKSGDRCANCDYDLGGLPSRICPECGVETLPDERDHGTLRESHAGQVNAKEAPAETPAPP